MDHNQSEWAAVGTYYHPVPRQCSPFCSREGVFSRFVYQISDIFLKKILPLLFCPLPTLGTMATKRLVVRVCQYLDSLTFRRVYIPIPGWARFSISLDENKTNQWLDLFMYKDFKKGGHPGHQNTKNTNEIIGVGA